MTQTIPTINYRALAEAILENLRHERDRQIVAQRFGLNMDRRQTLETIGSNFGITRERVRQIEKAATQKLKQSTVPELLEIDRALQEHLRANGHINHLDEVAVAFGAEKPAERSYIIFLATLAPGVEVIEESDHHHPSLAVLPEFDRQTIVQVIEKAAEHLKKEGKPVSVDALHAKIAPELSIETLENLARTSKKLSRLDHHWGLSHWPEVNPKSIRDKTYIVLSKTGKPLHFTEIATQIAGLGQRKRDVTVQAVHNELIKDPRFVLVGRGIYALREWGYTPGTVADIITDILREESPLHKDEIVRRVLKKRQVKPTTIVLNLQEKDQFKRVAKATYALK